MVPSLFDPGVMMSYCNLGYAILGRIIEVLRHKSYDQVLSDYLFEPLGMKLAFSRPEDSLRFNCAVGHVPSVRTPGVWHVNRNTYLSFGQKAAGSTPTMSATDLLSFAHMHMNKGKSRAGTQILKASTVKRMQRRQIKMPKHSPGGIHSWGLSWSLMDWNGQKLYGHDGATLGQFAYLRILPAKRLAVAMLTNGGNATGLYNTVYNELMGAIAKVSEPELPPPAKRQPNLEVYTGAYENITMRINVSMKDDQLMFELINKDSARAVTPPDCGLTFIDKNTARLNTGDPVVDRTTALFSGYDDAGRPAYLQSGFRQFPRVE